LWATTGGGPLVRLDPVNGEILERFGDGMQLGLALNPDSGKLYISMSSGIVVFDPVTQNFSNFSSTRVHSLAFTADGILFATSWPEDGNVLRFDQHGNAEIVVKPETAATGIAFGLDETPLADLMFLSHGEGGSLTMIDMVTMKSVEVAAGGTRGEFIHVSPSGRLYVTQTNQVDVFFPVTAPRVIATMPVNGIMMLPVVASATVRFDVDMMNSTGLDPDSVNNPANYSFINKTTGRKITISEVNYDSASRSATLRFEPLPAGTYELSVLASLKSESGLALTEIYTTEFTVMVDVTANVKPLFANTRIERKTGNYLFDVSVTNTLAFNLLSPWRLIFTGIEGTTAAVGNADGTTDEGYQYIELSGPETGILRPGKTTGVMVVKISNPDYLAFDLLSRVNVEFAPNLLPIISTNPEVSAQVDVAYTYQASAEDPEGSGISYVLVIGPEGAALDPATGLLSWTPTTATAATVDFEIRVYDERAGFAVQKWQVDVAGVNTPPVLFPIGDQTTEEGSWLMVPVAAIDNDGDNLVWWAANLPENSTFDVNNQIFRWLPDGNAAGRYTDILFFVSDGTTEVYQSFSVVVSNVNQSPVVQQPVSQTITEGQAFSVTMTAIDVDDEDLGFFSRNLPYGAFLHPETGLFSWTPEYNQHGVQLKAWISGVNLAPSGSSGTVQVNGGGSSIISREPSGNSR